MIRCMIMMAIFGEGDRNPCLVYDKLNDDEILKRYLSGTQSIPQILEYYSIHSIVSNICLVTEVS